MVAHCTALIDIAFLCSDMPCHSMLCHALSLGAVHCLKSSCARRPGLCPGALICEIWFARLQVAALGSAASANRLHCYDTHTLDTPEHALGFLRRRRLAASTCLPCACAFCCTCTSGFSDALGQYRPLKAILLLGFSGITGSSLLCTRSYCCLPQRSWPAKHPNI